MKENTIEAEIVEEEFKAPILKDIKYPVNKTDLAALLEEYKDIPTIDPEADDTIVAEQFKFVLDGHKKFVKARTSIEKIRKELKAPSIEYGKRVDGIAKEFQSQIIGVEQKLFTQRKIVEDNESRKQQEAEEAEELRVETIKSKIFAIKNLPLDHFNSDTQTLTNALEALRTITEAEYQEFTEEASQTQALTISQLQQARETKVKAEQADIIEAERAEKQRLDDEAKAAEVQREREAFETEKAEFEKQKQDAQKTIDDQQEEINRQNAEREADELMKKQEQEKDDRLAIEKHLEETKKQQETETFDNAYNETLDKFEAYDSMTSLLDSIIDGVEFKHLKWEV